MLPQTSNAIEQTSPTQADRLECPARVAFDQQSDGTSFEKSPAAKLGTVVHRALELVAKGADIEEAWTAACEASRAEGSDPETLPSARRMHLRYRSKAADLLTLLAEHPDHERRTELHLATPDSRIRGTADLVLVGTDDVIVIDHKTGLVTEADQAKSNYQRQIQLYASMARSTFDRPVTRGVLLSLREGEVDVDVSDASVDEAEHHTRTLLEDFNERAPGPQPAHPDTANCQWCPHCPSCDAFWEAVSADWIDSLGVCLRGTPLRVEIASRGIASMEVSIANANAELPDHAVVTQIPERHLAGHAEIVHAALTGLRRHHRSEGVLVWGNRSRISVH